MPAATPPPAAPPAKAIAPILFYDGDCGLCAASVQWCLDHDHRGILRFAPLQGPTYAAITAPHKPTDVSTMVLLDETGLHTRSDAALRCLHHLGGLWSPLASITGLIPRFMRDYTYAFIAHHRIAWFGRADACKLPTESQRQRFLP